MVKVAVSLRMATPPNLKEGNLRGEPRWERQVLESLYESDMFEVFTRGFKWDNAPMVTKKQAADTVLIIQDFQPAVIKSMKWAGVVVNLFAEPWKEHLGEVAQLREEYGDRLIFTYGFPKIHYSKECLFHQSVGKENLTLLPVPAVPYIYRENNFDKKILLMPYRMLLNSLNVGVGCVSINNTLSWLGDILEEFDDYKVNFISGYTVAEATETRMYESLGNVAGNKKLLNYRNRVKIYNSLPWSGVLDIYKETKVMCHHAINYGGPPMESAMHGVPFVGHSLDANDASFNTGPLALCPNFLGVPTIEDSLPILDKLIKNREYYTLIGNSYRDYVEKTYSYTAFADNLMCILNDKGLA